MVLDAIREFVTLSDQVGVKGSDQRVRELMAALRRSGFSSPKIRELSGGKWSDTLVRQYTRDWGGVDDSLSTQRENIMASLRKLASSGRGVEDVDAVLRMDRSVRAKGSSIDEVAELNSNLGKLDLMRWEIGKLVTLSRELGDQDLTAANVLGWIALDKKLEEDGFNKPARAAMFEMCEKYGGVYETRKLVNEFDSLERVRKRRERLEDQVKLLKSETDRLRTVKESLDMEIGKSKKMIDAANTARVAGFDAMSLGMVSVLAKDLGGPFKVMDAIRKYSSLKAMDEELEAGKAELKRVKEEISTKSGYLYALNYSLEEVKKAYDGNRDVRLVVELLVNPRDVKMERVEVVRLLKLVLESGVQHIEESPTIVSPLSPDWEAAYENIKALAERLKALTDPEAKGS